jgi:ribonuclease P protein component
LRKNKEINLIFSKGKSFFLSEITFRYVHNKLPNSRIAVLVGKKLSKKAVIRNRIRRRLRELARLHFSKIPNSLDILIIARDLKLREMDFRELEEKFLVLTKKLPTQDKC